jgi:hypothetical protein
MTGKIAKRAEINAQKKPVPWGGVELDEIRDLIHVSG